MIKSIPRAEFEQMVEQSRVVAEAVQFEINEAIPLMEPCARKLYSILPGMYRVMEVGDFVNECVLHFMEKKYLERFDGRTSKIYFVFVGMKHRAIDMLRHSNHVVKLMSEQIRSGTEDEMELSIYDVVPNGEPMDPIGEMIVDEAIEILSRKDPLKKEFDTREFGKVTFCEYTVFKFHLKGYDRKDMAEIFGVTTATIGNYLKAAQARLTEWYRN